MFTAKVQSLRAIIIYVALMEKKSLTFGHKFLQKFFPTKSEPKMSPETSYESVAMLYCFSCDESFSACSSSFRKLYLSTRSEFLIFSYSQVEILDCESEIPEALAKMCNTLSCAWTLCDTLSSQSQREFYNFDRNVKHFVTKSHLNHLRWFALLCLKRFTFNLKKLFQDFHFFVIFRKNIKRFSIAHITT